MVERHIPERRICPVLASTRNERQPTDADQLYRAHILQIPYIAEINFPLQMNTLRFDITDIGLIVDGRANTQTVITNQNPFSAITYYKVSGINVVERSDTQREVIPVLGRSIIFRDERLTNY
jgi:hypothetical protein